MKKVRLFIMIVKGSWIHLSHMGFKMFSMVHQLELPDLTLDLTRFFSLQIERLISFFFNFFRSPKLIFITFQTTYQSLCPSKRETVFLNLDPDYEYRPDYYEEVQCAHRPITTDNRIQSPVNIN